jgi:hypothetical protein
VKEVAIGTERWDACVAGECASESGCKWVIVTHRCSSAAQPDGGSTCRPWPNRFCRGAHVPSHQQTEAARGLVLPCRVVFGEVLPPAMSGSINRRCAAVFRAIQAAENVIKHSKSE